MASFFLDSLSLGANPSNITLYLQEKFPSNLKKVSLKSVTFDYKQPEAGNRIVYIHCDILNKDDNLFNGKKSDILGVTAIKPMRFGPSFILEKSYKTLKYTDFTSITIYLSEPFKNLKRIVYELDFV